MKPKLAVLLATYNGSKYITEQIESIYKQTYKDFVLYIRDDGSTDNTLELINGFSSQYKNIVVIDNENRNLGAKDSFLSMLRQVDADYYMFADQDDIWLRNKIEKSLSAIKDAEKNDVNIPVLSVCDCKVVDKNLHVIDESFWHYTKMHPKDLLKPNHFMVFNSSPGCTMILNNALKKSMFPIPSKVLMHDWWAAVVAQKYGKISIINESLMLYRQHGSNTLGANQIDRGYFKNKLANLTKFISNQKSQLEFLKEINGISVAEYYRIKIIHNLRRFF